MISISEYVCYRTFVVEIVRTIAAPPPPPLATPAPVNRRHLHRPRVCHCLQFPRHMTSRGYANIWTQSEDPYISWLFLADTSQRIEITLRLADFWSDISRQTERDYNVWDRVAWHGSLPRSTQFHRMFDRPLDMWRSPTLNWSSNPLVYRRHGNGSIFWSVAWMIALFYCKSIHAIWPGTEDIILLESESDFLIQNYPQFII